jgi:DNA-binding SARP family transcriptional activator
VTPDPADGYLRAVELGVLGPLTVSIDGAGVALERPKERALLTVVALARDEPVNRDRIIDALWGVEVPRAPAAALRAHVRRLRAVLGADAIQTTPLGYACNRETIVDADCFRVEVHSSGNAVVRVETIGRALARWRGRPYDDLGDWEPVRAERQGLLALYAHAREEWAAARIEIGESTSLVPLLEELVVEAPLVDRRWELLMLGLYRAGRQADALRAFQRARHALGEVGLEPGASLGQLDRAIAAHEVVTFGDRRTITALVERAVAERAAGRAESARDAFERAEVLTRQADDAGALAELGIAWSGDGPLSGLNPGFHVVQLLQEALAGLPAAPTAVRSRLLARLAVVAASNHDPVLVTAYAREAVSIARLIGDNRALAAALYAQVSVARDPTDLDGSEALARELTKITGDDTNHHVLGLCALARIRAQRGDVDDAARLAHEATARARDASADVFFATTWYSLFHAYLASDLDAARAAASAIGGVARRVLLDPEAAQAMTNAIAVLARAVLSTDVGADAHELRLDSIAWPQPNLGYLAHAGIARRRALSGDDPGARAALEPVTTEVLALLAQDMYWPAIVWSVSSVTYLLRDGDRADALYPTVLPFAGQLLIDPAGAFLGCADHHLGLLSAACDRLPEARAHLDTATSTYERIGAPGWAGAAREARSATR